MQSGANSKNESYLINRRYKDDNQSVNTVRENLKTMTPIESGRESIKVFKQDLNNVPLIEIRVCTEPTA